MEPVIQQLAPADFPPLLEEIPDPPKTLWVQGTLPSFDYAWLTVVGSRKYTPYGKEATEHLIRGLRGAPIVVVSGLALGIDSVAHKAALDAGLPTVAVPGSGLSKNVLYPRSNYQLALSIVKKGGALLSEFEPDFKATKWSFPQRNRIMAGIAHATLLIEAGEKSGTLITARLASDYNRDVLVVPGSIFNANSHGVHQFLKLGATPVQSAEDILEALDITKDAGPQKTPTDLSLEEGRVLELIANPLPKDELVHALSLPITQTNVLLGTMELKGLIREEGGVVKRA